MKIHLYDEPLRTFLADSGLVEFPEYFEIDDAGMEWVGPIIAAEHPKETDEFRAASAIAHYLWTKHPEFRCHPLESAPGIASGEDKLMSVVLGSKAALWSALDRAESTYGQVVKAIETYSGKLQDANLHLIELKGEVGILAELTSGAITKASQAQTESLQQTNLCLAKLLGEVHDLACDPVLACNKLGETIQTQIGNLGGEIRTLGVVIRQGDFEAESRFREQVQKGECHIRIGLKWLRRLAWVGLIYGLIALGLLTMVAVKSFGQQGISVIQYRDSLGNLVATFAAPYTVKCNTNLTCTRLGSTLTIDSANGLSFPLTSAQGGTGNGFTKFIGPTTAEKTFTLPDASATVLTTNALVTTAQGGTGASTFAAQTALRGPADYGAAAAAPTVTTMPIQAIPALAMAAFDNQILSSAVDASGYPAFLTVNAGLNLNILGGTTPIVMFIAGKWQTLSSNVVITLTASKNQFIYAALDVANAAMVVADFGASEFPPITNWTAPGAPATDQHWFDLSTNTMKRYSGAAWVAVNRIFIGVARTSGAAIDGVICEPYRLSPQKRFELFGDASDGILEVTGATTVNGFKQYSFVRVDSATLTHTAWGVATPHGLQFRSQNPALIINTGLIDVNGKGRAAVTATTGTGVAGAIGGFYVGGGAGSGGAGVTNGGGVGGNFGHPLLPSNTLGANGAGTGGGVKGVGGNGVAAPTARLFWPFDLHFMGVGPSGAAGAGDGTRKGGKGGAGAGSFRGFAPAWLIDATSSITANGNPGLAGENSGAANFGGGGGGGGGGGIVVVAGGYVNNLGTISAAGGTPGPGGTNDGAAGGTGGAGTALTVRLW